MLRSGLAADCGVSGASTDTFLRGKRTKVAAVGARPVTGAFAGDAEGA